MRKPNLHVTIAGTDGCEILPELDHRPTDMTIVKKRYSAFFGTDLEAPLKRVCPDLLIVAGINTHASAPRSLTLTSAIMKWWSQWSVLRRMMKRIMK